MESKNLVLTDIVGQEFQETLAERTQALLFRAYAASGTAMGPHSITVRDYDDPMDRAACAILSARKLIKQHAARSEHQVSYDVFFITDEGIRVAKRLVASLAVGISASLCEAAFQAKK